MKVSPLRCRTPRILFAAGVLALGLAACGGDGGNTSGDPTTEPDLRVMGTDALKFEPTELTADAGTVAVELQAGETVEHNFVVEELDNTQVVMVQPGQSAVGTVELEPGTYTFYCSVPGHRTAGMEGTLTVE